LPSVIGGPGSDFIGPQGGAPPHFLDREQHAIAERADLVPAEEFHFGKKRRRDRDDAVAVGRASPERVQRRP
jgi:hypothetical protein